MYLSAGGPIYLVAKCREILKSFHVSMMIVNHPDILSKAVGEP